MMVNDMILVGGFNPLVICYIVIEAMAQSK